MQVWKGVVAPSLCLALFSLTCTQGHGPVGARRGSMAGAQSLAANEVTEITSELHRSPREPYGLRASQSLKATAMIRLLGGLTLQSYTTLGASLTISAPFGWPNRFSEDISRIQGCRVDRNDGYVPMIQPTPSNANDKAEWCRITTSNPSLDSWGSELVAHRGWAEKQSPKGKIGGGAWQSRYWLVTSKFAIYFKSDKPSAPAAGCIYLRGAKIDADGGVEDGKGTQRVVITPCTPRRPGGSLLVQDCSFALKVPLGWIQHFKELTASYQTKLQLTHSDNKSMEK